MIKRLQIQNYKALRDVTLDLTPIHVLIGPNDSGKTSILEAFAALCRSVDMSLDQAFAGTWEGRQLVWFGSSEASVRFTADIASQNDSLKYSLACSFHPKGRYTTIAGECVTKGSVSTIEKIGDRFSRVCRIGARGESDSDETLRQQAIAIYNALSGVHSFRWDPRFLALPVAPDSERQFRMESTGFGLAMLLDDILGYDRDLFAKLEERFCQVFPQIQSIKLKQEPAFKSPVDDPRQVPMLQKSDGKGIYFQFREGRDPVPARQVSDGILLVLAYLAELHLPQPPRVLLVEEPENGIHPKRLQDVLSILRMHVNEQAHTQVVLTTHSPYVVDFFKAEEVTLCQKEEDGSVSVHRLSESNTVREQLDIFTLGEIWTAEGDSGLATPMAK